MDTQPTVENQGAAENADTDATSTEAELIDETGLIEDELLVEEISIDGMCGVY